MGNKMKMDVENRRTDKKEQESIDGGFYVAGWILIACAVAYGLLVKLTGIQYLKYLPLCAFHQVTGLYCPGCGGTRASFAFLHGHVLWSFAYHPFVPVAGIMGIWFMATQTLERLTGKKYKFTLRYKNGYLYFVLGIVIVNFVVRNLVYLFTGFTVL